METVLLDGIAAGTIAVVLCTSEIAAPIRKWIKKPLHCTFCTTFWTSLLYDQTATVFATMGVANIAVLLIHWSLSTYETTTEDEATESDGEAEDDRE